MKIEIHAGSSEADLILAMLPLGFLMQDAGEDTKLLLYRAHAAIGLLVLLFTVTRLVWKLVDARPAPRER